MTDPSVLCSVPVDEIWTSPKCQTCKFCELNWFSEDVLKKDQMSFWEYELVSVANERKELLE